MRKLFLLTFLLVNIFFISSAEGVDWKFIARGEEGYNSVDLYIDIESIKHVSKTVVRAWIKKVYLKPVPKDSKELVEILGYDGYDCAEMKHHNFQLTFRYSDGTSRTSTYPEKEWRYITPGTIHSVIYDGLCKQGK